MPVVLVSRNVYRRKETKATKQRTKHWPKIENMFSLDNEARATEQPDNIKLL